MREFVDHRNRGDVHGVARGRLVGADAAFAEDHVVVAAGQDVLAESSSSSMVAAMPRLNSIGLRDIAQLAQQIEVLHIARADLEEIDVGQHRLDLRNLHDLADPEQAMFPCSSHDLRPGMPRP